MTTRDQWQQIAESVNYTPEGDLTTFCDDDGNFDEGLLPTMEQVLDAIAGTEIPDDENEQYLAISDAACDIYWTAKETADKVATEAELAVYDAKQEALESLQKLACEATRTESHQWHYSASHGSRYLAYRGQVSIRVSDHQQKPGGGWIVDQYGQGRAGEADIDLYVGMEQVPTVAQLRSMIAAALRPCEA